MKKFLLLIVVAIIFSSVTVEAKKFGDNYCLEKVLILSRHNLRAPNVERIVQLSPHAWCDWKVSSGETTLRGEQLEMSLGKFFREYLLDEGFITESHVPTAGEFRFYANSFQRTISSAKYFSGGLLPGADVEIEHALPLNHFNEVFNAKLTFTNEKFLSVATHELAEYCGVDDLHYAAAGLKNEFALLERLLDFQNSPYALKSGRKHFALDDSQFVLEQNKLPTIRGDLIAAFTAANALVMQYHETSTAFGQPLDESQLRQVGHVKEFFIGMIGTRAIAVNSAHPLLKFLHDELACDRKFSFVCGHDTNLIAVLSALDAENYSLPDSIENRVPVGAKLVIERWRGSDGESYASVNLVYMSTAQILNLSPFTLESPPKIFPVRLKGLQTNSDGLYLFADIERKFSDALAEYDALKS